MWDSRRAGFTIVELLIVIVVIAILAAITIVAYNGIRDRASSSSVQSVASQIGKKVLAYAPQNNDLFPQEATVAQDLGLPANTTQRTYDYYTSDTQKAFCVSVTDTSKDPEIAYAFTQDGQIVQGRCIENLVTNPSFETSLGTNWSFNPSSPLSYASASAPCGSTYRTATLGGASNGWIAHFGNASSIPATANSSYALSAQVRRSTSGTGQASIDWRTSSFGPSGQGTGTVVTLPSTVWTRATSISISPANNAYIQPSLLIFNGLANETFDIDCVMLTKTSKNYSYGDGDSPRWSWSGVRSTSTSFGPATQL